MSPLAEPIRHAGPVPPELARELGGGERLLWSGQPLPGLRFQRSDLFLVPFSLFWCGFVFFAVASAFQKSDPPALLLFLLLFVVTGLYLVAGRFFFDAWRRARTHYAVTSERVLIVDAAPGRKVTSLALSDLRELTLQERGSGVGTISFGRGGLGALFGAIEGWPGAERHLPPRFRLLLEARRVHDLIRTAQRLARPA
jgi:hypothetical protein